MVPGWLLTLVSETPGGQVDGGTRVQRERARGGDVPIKNTSAWKMENVSRFNEMTFSVTVAV